MQLAEWLLPVAGLFNSKIKLGVDGRKNLKLRLTEFRNSFQETKRLAWFHVASLGEFEQGRPVIEEFRLQYPEFAIVITFFSPSGYEVRKNYSGADFVAYLPIDTKSNSKWFVKILRPDIVFFVKYEFWHNYLLSLKNAGVSIISFSTIFRENQIYFKPFGTFFRNILKCFDHIFVQNESSVMLLNSIGISKTSIGGDTRFDRVADIVKEIQPRIALLDFINPLPCLIAGSVWTQDMEVLIPALNKLKGRMRVIIAPHEIRQDQISKWRNQLEAESICYSEIGINSLENAEILIIDNVGMLSSLYQYGAMAYIGGAFGVGLHNTLEAATFGLPLLFGNKSYHRFQEAVDLLELGGAVAISSEKECFEILHNWVDNPVDCKLKGEINANYVLENTGATHRILAKVKGLLKL